MIGRRLWRQRGQSSVEFALVIPLLLVALLLVVQVALVAYAQLAVTHIARESARTLAVVPDTSVAELHHGNGLLGPDDLHIVALFEPIVQSNRKTVSVLVTYDIPLITPMFATFFGDMSVRAEAKMLVEW